MTDPIVLTLPIAPMSKARPRFVHGGHAFLPARYRTWLDEAKRLAALAWRGRDVLDGALTVELEFRGPKRPAGDLDNLAGGILDALTGIAYLDDKQIDCLNVGIWPGDSYEIFIVLKPTEKIAWPKKTRKKVAS